MSIYSNLFDNSVVPFVLAAIGLGVIVGCMSSLRARWEILVELRKNAGLSFYILSYSTAWDHFLMSAKKHAPIAVELGGDWIIGHLQNFSIKKEQKQLVLDGFKISSKKSCENDEIENWLKENGGECKDFKSGQMLITEADEIKKIVIHRKGLKKHGHALSHSAQAFYCALMTLGFLLLALSFHKTYDFISNCKMCPEKFPFLESFYCLGFVVGSVFSIISLVAGIILLKMDYSSVRVACNRSDP